MMEKCLIWLLCLSFTLFVLRWTFYCGDDNHLSIILNEKIFDHDDSINIGFSFFEFEQAKHRDKVAIAQYDLTAIMLYRNESEDIEKALEYLVKSNVFKEIIVWNDNTQTNFTIDQLIKNTGSGASIRLIHSKQNIRSLGKYYACLESITRACFYVDHQWKSFPHLKSMASSFRSAPYLLHSITDFPTFYRHLIFTYSVNRSDFYSEKLVNSRGRVFLREYAQRYIHILNKHLEINISKKQRTLNERRFHFFV